MSKNKLSFLIKFIAIILIGVSIFSQSVSCQAGSAPGPGSQGQPAEQQQPRPQQQGGGGAAGGGEAADAGTTPETEPPLPSDGNDEYISELTKYIFKEFDVNKNGYLGWTEFEKFWNLDRVRPEDVVQSQYEKWIGTEIKAIYDKARADNALGVSPFQLDALFGTETEAQKELKEFFAQVHQLQSCDRSGTGKGNAFCYKDNGDLYKEGKVGENGDGSTAKCCTEMKIISNYVLPAGQVYSRAQSEWISLFNQSKIPITISDGSIYKCLERNFFVDDPHYNSTTGIQPVNQQLFPGWQMQSGCIADDTLQILNFNGNSTSIKSLYNSNDNKVELPLRLINITSSSKQLVDSDCFKIKIQPNFAIEQIDPAKLAIYKSQFEKYANQSECDAIHEYFNKCVNGIKVINDKDINKVVDNLTANKIEEQQYPYRQEIQYERSKLYPNGTVYGVPYENYLRLLEAGRLGDYPEGYVPFQRGKEYECPQNTRCSYKDDYTMEMTVVAFEPLPSIQGSIRYLTENPVNETFELDIEAIEFYPASTGGCDGPMNLSSKVLNPTGFHFTVNRGAHGHNLSISYNSSILLLPAVHQQSVFPINNLSLLNDSAPFQEGSCLTFEFKKTADLPSDYVLFLEDTIQCPDGTKCSKQSDFVVDMEITNPVDPDPCPGLANEGESCIDQCVLSGSCEFCGSGRCCQQGVAEYGCHGWEGGAYSHVCVPAWSCNYTSSINGTIGGLNMPYDSNLTVQFEGIKYYNSTTGCSKGADPEIFVNGTNITLTPEQPPRKLSFAAAGDFAASETKYERTNLTLAEISTIDPFRTLRAGDCLKVMFEPSKFAGHPNYAVFKDEKYWCPPNTECVKENGWTMQLKVINETDSVQGSLGPLYNPFGIGIQTIVNLQQIQYYAGQFGGCSISTPFLSLFGPNSLPLMSLIMLPEVLPVRFVFDQISLANDAVATSSALNVANIQLWKPNNTLAVFDQGDCIQIEFNQITGYSPFVQTEYQVEADQAWLRHFRIQRGPSGNILNLICKEQACPAQGQIYWSVDDLASAAWFKNPDTMIKNFTLKEVRYKQWRDGGCAAPKALLKQEFVDQMPFKLQPFLFSASLMTANDTLGVRDDANRALFQFQAAPNLVKGPQIGELYIQFPIYYQQADAPYYIFEAPLFECQFGFGDEQDNALFASGYKARILRQEAKFVTLLGKQLAVWLIRYQDFELSSLDYYRNNVFINCGPWTNPLENPVYTYTQAADTKQDVFNILTADADANIQSTTFLSNLGSGFYSQPRNSAQYKPYDLGAQQKPVELSQGTVQRPANYMFEIISPILFRLNGCYLKFTFPEEFVQFVPGSLSYEGYGMLVPQETPGAITYSNNTENYVVVQGCQSNLVIQNLTDQNFSIKIKNIQNPLSVSTTKPITVDFYLDAKLSRQVMKTSYRIQASQLQAANIAVQELATTEKLIQSPTIQTYTFTNTAAMPFGSSAGRRSSLHIAFPKLVDNNANANHLKDVITIQLVKDAKMIEDVDWEQDYEQKVQATCNVSMCYSIYFQSQKDIQPQEFVIKIKNLLNPQSIAPAGVFTVSTLLKFAEQSEWSLVSQGFFNSKYVGVAGSLDPKEMKVKLGSGLKYAVTCAVDTVYVVQFKPIFNLYKGDFIRLTVPPAYSIASEAQAIKNLTLSNDAMEQAYIRTQGAIKNIAYATGWFSNAKLGTITANITQDMPAGFLYNLQVGGIRNPRYIVQNSLFTEEEKQYWQVSSYTGASDNIIEDYLVYQGKGGLIDTDVLSGIDDFSMKPYYRINRQKPQIYLTFLAVNKTSKGDKINIGLPSGVTVKGDSNGKVSCSNAPTRALNDLNKQAAKTTVAAGAVTPEEPECLIKDGKLVVQINYLPAVAEDAVKIVVDDFEIPEGITTTGGFGLVYLSDSKDRLVSELKTKASISTAVEPCEQLFEIQKNSRCGKYFTDEFCCVKVTVHRKLAAMNSKQQLVANSLKLLGLPTEPTETAATCQLKTEIEQLTKVPKGEEDLFYYDDVPILYHGYCSSASLLNLSAALFAVMFICAL